MIVTINTAIWRDENGNPTHVSILLTGNGILMLRVADSDSLLPVRQMAHNQLVKCSDRKAFAG